MTDKVTPHSVRTQLAKLRAAEPFVSSPQLVSFLDYVVEETLEGRERALKGYTIAVEALGRPPEFDPQADPIVRVEARRLRQALRSYYEASGKDDDLVITMPTGGYVPAFAPAERDAPPPDEAPDIEDDTLPANEEEFKEAGSSAIDAPPLASPRAVVPVVRPLRATITRRFAIAAAAAAGLFVLAGGVLLREVSDRAAEAARIAAGHGSDLAEARLPAIRVLDFDAAGGDVPPIGIARRLAERFAVSLSRFDEIRVIGPSAPASASDGAYLMRGRVTKLPAGGYSFGVALLAPLDREVLLAREYPSFQPQEINPADGAASEQQVVRALTIEIAQPLGFIGADQMKRLASENSPEARCLYAAQAYWRGPTAEKHAQARACLKGPAAAYIPRALVESHLSFLALDEFRNDYDRQPDPPPLDRALAHARAAVEASPSSARAQQAMMDALFLRGQTEEALRAGARAMELNPFDMDTLADYGARLVQVGRVSEGRAKLLEAAEALPIRPPWHDFHLVLSAALLDDPAAAVSQAKNMVSESDPLSLIAQILAARARQAPDQAEAFGRKLVALDPRFRTEPRAMLERRMLAPPILDFLTAAVESATRGDRSDSRKARPARAG